MLLLSRSGELFSVAREDLPRAASYLSEMMRSDDWPTRAAVPEFLRGIDFYNVRWTKHDPVPPNWRGRWKPRLLRAIEEWMQGAGPDDPLEEFSVPDLAETARLWGITPPDGADKPALKDLLYAKARLDTRMQREENRETAGERLGTVNAPPVGTRRDVVGGYIVREAPAGAKSPVAARWAVYREDGTYLGQAESGGEAAEIIARGDVVEGQRIDLDGGAWAVREGDEWAVWLPGGYVHSNTVDAGEIGRAATVDEARQMAAAEVKARRPKRKTMAPSPETTPPSTYTGPKMTVAGKAPRKLTVREKVEEAVAAGRYSRETAKALLTGRLPDPPPDAEMTVHFVGGLLLGVDILGRAHNTDDLKAFLRSQNTSALADAAATLGAPNYNFHRLKAMREKGEELTHERVIRDLLAHVAKTAPPPPPAVPAGASLTVVQLRNALRSAGLPTSGKKPALVERYEKMLAELGITPDPTPVKRAPRKAAKKAGGSMARGWVPVGADGAPSGLSDEEAEQLLDDALASVNAWRVAQGLDAVEWAEAAEERSGVVPFARGRSVVFDADARDADRDGMVQEGTPFERPAVPDAATPGWAEAYAARQATLRAKFVEGVKERKLLAGGQMGETYEITFTDGTKGILKTAKKRDLTPMPEYQNPQMTDPFTLTGKTDHNGLPEREYLADGMSAADLEEIRGRLRGLKGDFDRASSGMDIQYRVMMERLAIMVEDARYRERRRERSHDGLSSDRRGDRSGRGQGYVRRFGLDVHGPGDRVDGAGEEAGVGLDRPAGAGVLRRLVERGGGDREDLTYSAPARAAAGAIVRGLIGGDLTPYQRRVLSEFERARKPVGFDPKARDADDDGKVQDATPWERPAVKRPGAKSASTGRAKKLTPGQAQAEFGADPEKWAQAARDGRVSRPEAARRIRSMARMLSDSTSIRHGGWADFPTPESRESARKSHEEGMARVARLRALADEVEARPKKAAPAKTPAKAAKKATPAKAPTDAEMMAGYEAHEAERAKRLAAQPTGGRPRQQPADEARKAKASGALAALDAAPQPRHEGAAEMLTDLREKVASGEMTPAAAARKLDRMASVFDDNKRRLGYKAGSDNAFHAGRPALGQQGAEWGEAAETFRRLAAAVREVDATAKKAAAKATRLARKGDRVEVTLPDGTTKRGTVTTAPRGGLARIAMDGAIPTRPGASSLREDVRDTARVRVLDDQERVEEMRTEARRLSLRAAEGESTGLGSPNEHQRARDEARELREQAARIDGTATTVTNTDLEDAARFQSEERKWAHKTPDEIVEEASDTDLDRLAMQHAAAERTRQRWGIDRKAVEAELKRRQRKRAAELRAPSQPFSRDELAAFTADMELATSDRKVRQAVKPVLEALRRNDFEEASRRLGAVWDAAGIDAESFDRWTPEQERLNDLLNAMHDQIGAKLDAQREHGRYEWDVQRFGPASGWSIIHRTPGADGERGEWRAWPFAQGLPEDVARKYLRDKRRIEPKAAARGAAGAAPRAKTFNVDETRQRLQSATTREEAHDALKGLTKAQLLEVAEAGGYRGGVRAGDSRDNIRDVIVQSAVGRVLDSIATRHGGKRGTDALPNVTDQELRSLLDDERTRRLLGVSADDVRAEIRLREQSGVDSGMGLVVPEEARQAARDASLRAARLKAADKAAERHEKERDKLDRENPAERDDHGFHLEVARHIRDSEGDPDMLKAKAADIRREMQDARSYETLIGRLGEDQAAALSRRREDERGRALTERVAAELERIADTIDNPPAQGGLDVRNIQPGTVVTARIGDGERQFRIGEKVVELDGRWTGSYEAVPLDGGRSMFVRQDQVVGVAGERSAGEGHVRVDPQAAASLLDAFTPREGAFRR